MKKLLENWTKFWFSEISPYPISAFRIAFGAYLLIYFLWSLPYVGLFYSNEGVYSPFQIPDIAPPPIIAWLIYLLTLGLISAFTVGYKTKIVTPLLFGLFLYYYFINFAVKNCSYDRLIIFFLIVLSFADLEGAWSISRRGLPVKAVNGWATKLLALHVAIFYFGTGFYKAFTPYWHTGQIVKMTFTSNWGTPAAFWLINLNLPMWIYDLATWGLIAFELSVGVLFYIPKVQKYAFGLATFFHLSVWVFLGIPQFMLCPATYFLFVSPTGLEALGKSIQSFFKEKIILVKSLKKAELATNA